MAFTSKYPRESFHFLRFGSRVGCAAGLLLVVGLFGGCGFSSKSPSTSSVQSVDLPQTEVRDQGRFGVCWSYGTMGLVESVSKTHGVTVDLSEEAIVFYHMAEGIRQMMQTMTMIDLMSALSRGNLPEGWNARTVPEDELQVPPGVQKQHDALTLLSIYGAVPESAWSFKVTSEAEKNTLKKAITKNIYAYMNSGGRSIQLITLDEVMDQILVGEGAYPSRPPTQLTWQGVEMSSTTFLKDVLKFRSDQFDSFVVREESQFERFVMTMKEALVSGYAVPLAFPINIDRVKEDLFKGSDITDANDWVSFARDGGHLVLVTDFVNQGGFRGRMEQNRVWQELLAPASLLQEIIFKNSWGIGAKTNEAGLPIGGSNDGYYRMDAAYLKGAMRVSKLTGSRYNTVQAVMPKAILTKNF
jgi:hypothetical protein